MSDIIRFRQLIDSGYSISCLTIDELGQTVIKFVSHDRCHPVEEQIFLFITQDQAVIQKAKEILMNSKKV